MTVLFWLIAQNNGDGVIKGVVKFKGSKPARKPLKEVEQNPYCKERCGGKFPWVEDWVFGKNGEDDTLQYVLVYVTKGLEEKKFDPPKQPAVIDQVACVYTPHVVAFMAGQPLEIRNSDETLHNVMCATENNTPFNDGMPGKGKMTKVFRNPEFKVRFKCAMHGWMTAYAHVLEHPFFDLTKADGTFSIQGLPPGEYELSALHESGRFEPVPTALRAKVAAGETKSVEFIYGPRKTD